MPYEDRRWFRCYTCHVFQSWAHVQPPRYPGCGQEMTPEGHRRLWHPGVAIPRPSRSKGEIPL